MALAFVTVLWCLAPGLAQAPEPPWAEKIFQNKTTHDFGTIAGGAQLKYSFPIKNIYAVRLEITKIEPSCGCITATTNKTVLEPQETGAIDIVIDGRRLKGAETKTIKVTVGPVYVSTATLVVTTNARKDVVFNPGEVSFGVVAQGQQPVQLVEIEYAGKLDWRIKKVVKPADAPFLVAVEEFRRQPPKALSPGLVGYRMTVKLAADAPGGPLKHDIVLETNDPASETLTIGVTGTVQAPLRVTPSPVELGTVKVGELKKYKVQVIGNRPFSITDIKSDHPDITAQKSDVMASTHTLTIQCEATSPGEFRRTVTIFTNLDRNPSVTLTVQGNAVQ
jgi:hypothetical protein